MSIELMKRALEFITGVYFGEHEGSRADREKLEADLTTAIQQAMAQQPVTGELVAWIRRHPNGALSNEMLTHVQVEQVRRDSGAWVPLYTHPAPNVPMTDEQIWLLLRDLPTNPGEMPDAWSFAQGVREAEFHHGITTQDKKGGA